MIKTQKDFIKMLEETKKLYNNEVLSLKAQSGNYDYWAGKASGIQLVIDSLKNINITS